MVCIHISIAFFAFISLVSATPIEGSLSISGIPISRKVGNLTAAELVTKEKLRAGSFANAATGNQPTTNEDVSYIAAVLVGNQTFNLIVDTGSSNTWVGAGTKYVPSSSSTRTNSSVGVSYGSGSFKGQEYTDMVTLGGLTVIKQSIGVATSSTGFSGVDGILGVGPVVLTQGTVSGLNTVPTFLDNLRSYGTITSEVLGVYFAPESGSDTGDANGELTLGGADRSKYSGTLSYVPKSTTSPYSYYWGVTVGSITYGSTKVSTQAQAIVDTGTTLIYIPTSAYNKFLSLAHGKTDSTTGLARFTTKPTQTFTIKLGSVSYPLTPAQYLVPSAQYAVFGLNQPYYYTWINDGGSTGVNFIIGQKFLENYYSVFDTTNSRLGFAVRT